MDQQTIKKFKIIIIYNYNAIYYTHSKLKFREPLHEQRLPKYIFKHAVRHKTDITPLSYYRKTSGTPKTTGAIRCHTRIQACKVETGRRKTEILSYKADCIAWHQDSTRASVLSD